MKFFICMFLFFSIIWADDDSEIKIIDSFNCQTLSNQTIDVQSIISEGPVNVNEHLIAFSERYLVYFDGNRSEKLLMILHKWKNWEKLAIEKQVKLEKQLPVNFTCLAIDLYESNPTYKLCNFKFFFSNESTPNNTGYLLFTTEQIPPFPVVMMDSDEVNKFISMIHDKEEKIKETKRLESIYDKFQ